MRLGQRVIQVDNSHIILTGADALNKVWESAYEFMKTGNQCMQIRRMGISVGKYREWEPVYMYVNTKNENQCRQI